MLKTLFLFPVTAALTLNGQTLPAACNQQAAVLRNISATHFDPPAFTYTTNLQVLDIFMKEADERNMIFLARDREELVQVLSQAEEADAFCLLVKAASAIFTRRVKQADSIVNAIEASSLVFSPPDTILFTRQPNERILSESLHVLSHRLVKRAKYETLSAMAQSGNSGDPVELPGNTINSIKENAFKKSTRRMRQFLSEYNSEENIVTHIGDCVSDAIAQRCDPHTNFLNNPQLESYQNALSTEEISFGFSAGEDENGNIIISDLVPGGPAWKSDNLNENDRLLSYRFENEKEVTLEYLELEDFEKLFSKAAGKTVELKVRKKDLKIKTVTLRKEKIQSQENALNSYVVSYQSRKLGYIPIPSFYLDQESDSRQGCANDVAKEIVELKQDSVTGIILDLRYNGGGSMREAIGLAGIFIDEGPVAIYRPRDSKPFVLKDINRGVIWDGPLVILVNSASASASEFVTAALQDYNRALVVGSTTFGKGTAQSVMLLDSGFAVNSKVNVPAPGYMKVTGGKFYRVTSESHQARGIVPDIELPGVIERVMEKESDYPYHMECDSVKKKIAYKKLPELPRRQLKQQSGLRQASNPRFAAISRLGDSLAVVKQGEEKIILTLPEFRIYSDRQAVFNQKIDGIFSDSTGAITFSNNTANSKIVALNSYEARNNENAIKSLEKDLLLHECIYILNDLVILLKQ